MYEAFYGLTEKPFNLTPDPRFLYLSDKHKEAFAHLLFGIRQRAGFVMVTGEIGTGKTTICRSLLGQLDSDTEVAFIFNPALSPLELLRKINEDFGIPSQAETVKGLIDELNDYLLGQAARGRNCVLVIDEAQNLAPPVLEQIRLLSNLETETQKLLQIVLIGQPELAQNLALPELRQLNQRISARYHLKPLNRDETVQYIAFRLRVAGGRRRIRLSRGAIRAVYRASGGTPRLINAVCDRALLIGYTREVRDITRPIVRRATKEIRGEYLRPRRQRPLWRYAPSPSFMGAAALIVLAGAFVIQAMGELAVGMASRPVWPVEPTRPIAASVSRVAEATATLDKPSAPVQIAKPPTVLFAELVDALDPVAARKAAVLGVFGKWNMAPLTYPGDDSLEGLRALARANGFVCEVLYPTLDQMEAINLPAFVKMAATQRPVWLGLLAIEGDFVRITSDIGGTANVPREAFEARYLQQAVVFWRDPTPGTPVLVPSRRGEEVRNLQQSLWGLGRIPSEPSGVYDAATVAAVKQIQRETGLTVDGLFGKQTRMVLTSWSPEMATPALAATSRLADAEAAALGTEAEAVRPDTTYEAQVAATTAGQAADDQGAESFARGDKPEDARTDVGSDGEEALPLAAPGYDTAAEGDRPAIDAGLGWPPALAVTELSEPETDLLLSPTGPGSNKTVTKPSTGGMPLVPRQTRGGGEEREELQ